MDYHFERKLLQAVILAGSAVPVLTGGTGVVTGLGLDLAGDDFSQADAVAIGSHVRYLSGLLLGIGLCFLYYLPTIERRTAEVRALTVIVLMGGLARLGASLAIGYPGKAMTAAIVMELAVTPALCVWQGRIARRALTGL